jgi:hypothetical protein
MNHTSRNNSKNRLERQDDVPDPSHFCNAHALLGGKPELGGVELHGLKPLAPPHASKGGTLRSLPHYAPNELRGVTPPRIHPRS